MVEYRLWQLVAEFVDRGGRSTNLYASVNVFVTVCYMLDVIPKTTKHNLIVRSGNLKPH